MSRKNNLNLKLWKYICAHSHMVFPQVTPSRLPDQLQYIPNYAKFNSLRLSNAFTSQARPQFIGSNHLFEYLGTSQLMLNLKKATQQRKMKNVSIKFLLGQLIIAMKLGYNITHCRSITNIWRCVEDLSHFIWCGKGMIWIYTGRNRNHKD